GPIAVHPVGLIRDPIRRHDPLVGTVGVDDRLVPGLGLLGQLGADDPLVDDVGRVGAILVAHPGDVGLQAHLGGYLGLAVLGVVGFDLDVILRFRIILLGVLVRV